MSASIPRVVFERTNEGAFANREGFRYINAMQGSNRNLVQQTRSGDRNDVPTTR